MPNDRELAPVIQDDRDAQRDLLAFLATCGVEISDDMRTAANRDFAAHRLRHSIPRNEVIGTFEQIDKQLWATSGSNNVRTLVACLEKIEQITTAAIRKLKEPM